MTTGRETWPASIGLDLDGWLRRGPGYPPNPLFHIPEADDIVRVLIDDINPAQKTAAHQILLAAFVDRAVDRELIVVQHAAHADLAVRIVLEEAGDPLVQDAAGAGPEDGDALDRIRADALRDARRIDGLDLQDKARRLAVLHHEVLERPPDDPRHLPDRDLPRELLEVDV